MKRYTRVAHGDTALKGAEQASNVLFGAEVTGLNAEEVLDVFNDVPSSQLDKSQFSGDGMNIVDLLLTCGLATSRGDARRLIEGGGIYLSNRRVTDIQQSLHLSDSVEGQVFVVRKGPRLYHLAKVV